MKKHLIVLVVVVLLILSACVPTPTEVPPTTVPGYEYLYNTHDPKAEGFPEGCRAFLNYPASHHAGDAWQNVIRDELPYFCNVDDGDYLGLKPPFIGWETLPNHGWAKGDQSEGKGMCWCIGTSYGRDENGLWVSPDVEVSCEGNLMRIEECAVTFDLRPAGIGLTYP